MVAVHGYGHRSQRWNPNVSSLEDTELHAPDCTLGKQVGVSKAVSSSR